MVTQLLTAAAYRPWDTVSQRPRTRAWKTLMLPCPPLIMSTLCQPGEGLGM